MSGMHLLLSDHRGVFIPRDYAEMFDFDSTVTDGWAGVKETDLEILRAGPDHELYWEAWDSVLLDANYTDKQGNEWRLWQDGDLWMFCEKLMTDEEFEALFQQEREED